MTPILSLFSGIGGLDIGFERAGFSVRLAIDNNKHAIASYQHNVPHARVVQADISVLRANDLMNLWHKDCDEEPFGIIGGPPCQGFSVANQQPKEQDSRNDLTKQYFTLIEELAHAFPKLSFFLFENVYGLVTMRRNRPYYEWLQKKVAALPFTSTIAVVDMWRYHVPQTRRRVVIVGVRNVDAPFVFPSGTSHPAVVPADILATIPEPDAAFHPNHVFSPNFGKNDNVLRRVQTNAQHQNPTGSISSYVVPASGLSRSITGKPYIHPRLHRRLTPYECLRLQTFPHSFVVFSSLRKQYQLIANAVPPNAAYEIARAIRACYHSLSSPQ